MGLAALYIYLMFHGTVPWELRLGGLSLACAVLPVCALGPAEGRGRRQVFRQFLCCGQAFLYLADAHTRSVSPGWCWAFVGSCPSHLAEMSLSGKSTPALVPFSPPGVCSIGLHEPSGA